MIPQKYQAGSTRNPACLRLLLAVAGLCCLLTQKTSAIDIGTGKDEVWFAPRADGIAGTGTPIDPYDGSGDKLRSTLANWRYGGSPRSGLTIHLMPGVYLSKQVSGANMPIPVNSRIIGAGVTNTIIRMSDTTNSAYGEYKVLQADSASAYSYVSDLTIDANFGATNVPAIGKGQCLWFTSGATNGTGGTTNAMVERVRFIGYGSTTNNGGECYVVNYQPPTAGTSSFVFQECSVEGAITSGGYGDCVTVYPNGAAPSAMYTNTTIIVRNNRFLNAPQNYAVNVAGANIVVEDNEFNYCTKGFYIDTGYANKVVIRNNRGIDVNQGITLNAGVTSGGYNGTTDVLIEGNNLEISDNLGPAVNFPTAGIHLKGWTTNVVIRNNTIGAFKPYQGTYHSNWYGIYMDGNASPQYNSVVGTSIYNNSISSDLNNLVLYAVLSYVYGNRTDEREVLPNGFPLWTGFWSGVTTADGVITSDMLKQGYSIYLAGFSQFYATNQGVVLPKPSDVPGRRFILQVYKGSYNSPTYQNCPLKISGQSGSSTTVSVDPSGGTSGAFAFDATLNLNQYFYLPSQKGFASWVYAFDSTTTTGQNSRTAVFDLYSNGYNWFLMNK
ncbi:MAG TPA: hypothetical protein VMF06_02820 [Candidatus Limnocylindria bacterium]|nr:hypothetical protein [Candidatus Limnocylindria bacterium]